MSCPYQICVRCIMDTTDSGISFDENGVCSHCRNFDELGRPIVEGANSAEGRSRLERLIVDIKANGKGKDYDCLIGISGGVDSSYVAWQVRQLGLRPLAVHFDSGWNSELAVNNIENIVKKLGIDLITVVVDWDEMRDVQLAFFKASLANCDIPTDHAFVAALYGVAVDHGIKTIISGGNAATEFILPRSWGYNANDLRHLQSVHKQFGSMPLKNYPTLGFFRRYFWYPIVRGIRTVRILDFMPYNKADAKKLIAEELGWRDYGGKHYESVFTRFFQAYYLPTKFGFDKRRAHLSSLIVSGQMSREDAMAEMLLPPDSTQKIADDKVFVAKKLGITVEEFDAILALPIRSFEDYPSQEWLFRLKDVLQRLVRRYLSKHAS